MKISNYRIPHILVYLSLIKRLNLDLYKYFIVREISHNDIIVFTHQNECYRNQKSISKRKYLPFAFGLNINNVTHCSPVTQIGH